MTKAVIPQSDRKFSFEDDINEEIIDETIPNLSSFIQKPVRSTIRGRVIEINILETWGDSFYVGLSGLEIIGNLQF
jgi:hypothetical protein